MSTFLNYMLSTDYGRYRDLEAVEGRANQLAAQSSGQGQQLHELAATVGQLAATVRVLTRVLADNKLLDMAKIEEAIKAEIRHPSDKADKRVHCTRCNVEGATSEMVKVGADVWCRSCAKNP